MSEYSVELDYVTYRNYMIWNAIAKMIDSDRILLQIIFIRFHVPKFNLNNVSLD